MPADAIFRIMSQTKAIVSVGAMMLYEQGKFLLDEPISDFIPEFKHPAVTDTPTRRQWTYALPNQQKGKLLFRDLLTHTSGIGYAAIGVERMNAIYVKAGIPSGLDILMGLDKMKPWKTLDFQPRNNGNMD